MLVALLSFSCLQEDDQAPRNLVQYEVECSHCLVIFNDNAFEKRIVVSGKLDYSFENTKLDTAYIQLTKSAHVPEVPARVVIRQGGKVLETWSGLIEWDYVNIKAPLR